MIPFHVDGGSEIYLYDYKGKMKKGSRLKIKLKNGYKAKIRYVCIQNGKWKEIKDNFKLPRSGNDWYIDLQVKKGKATAYYWLYPQSEE